MCGPLNLHNVALLIKIMDTQMRNVGLKVFSLVAIFMILIQNSSFKVAGASGDEQLETMMEEDENDLWYPSRSYGYIPNTNFVLYFLFLIVNLCVSTRTHKTYWCINFTHLFLHE